MFIKNTEIKIVRGDITELEADAIVNAANNKLIMGGGVAGAIKKKGGKLIEEEALKKGPIKIGEAVATTAGALKAKYVIHAATMGMDFKTDELKIRNACGNALKVADELTARSVALPALGCGVGGFRAKDCAKIISQEIFRHLRETKSGLETIILCLYDKEAFEVFNKVATGYIEHIIEKLQQGPFSTVDAIIEIGEKIVVIERSNPPFGFALPGGFVDYGESLEEAVVREAKEETGLGITDIRQFHTYSKPDRDPRFHTIGTVYIAKAKGAPRAGDDAAGARLIRLEEIEGLDFAFDHKDILRDYIKYRKADGE